MRPQKITQEELNRLMVLAAKKRMGRTVYLKKH